MTEPASDNKCVTLLQFSAERERERERCVVWSKVTEQRTEHSKRFVLLQSCQIIKTSKHVTITMTDHYYIYCYLQVGLFF